MNKKGLGTIALGILALGLSSCAGGNNGNKNKDTDILDDGKEATYVDIKEDDLSKVTYKDDKYLPFKSSLKKEITMGPDLTSLMIERAIQEGFGQEEEEEDEEALTQDKFNYYLQMMGLYGFALPDGKLRNYMFDEYNDYVPLTYEGTSLNFEDVKTSEEAYIAYLDETLIEFNKYDFADEALIDQCPENQLNFGSHIVGYKKKLGSDDIWLLFGFYNDDFQIATSPQISEWDNFPDKYGSGAERTVTFLDINGNVLESKKTTDFHGVEAPNDPIELGKVFLGWDKHFSIVTKDINVRPVYEDDFSGKHGYTAIFLKIDGSEFKRETYDNLDSSVYPAGPVIAGKEFVMWALDKQEGFTYTFKPIYKDGDNPHKFNTVAYCYRAIMDDLEELPSDEARVQYCEDLSNDLASVSAMRDYPDVFLNEGRALTLIMPTAEVMNNYASLLLHSGFRQEAVPYIENAVRLEPHNPVYLTNLAQMYFEYESYFSATFGKTEHYANLALDECSNFGLANQLLESIALENDEYDLALELLVESSKTVWNDISIVRWQSLYVRILSLYGDAYLDAMSSFDSETENDLEFDFTNPIARYLDDLKEIANIQTGKGKEDSINYKAPFDMNADSICPGLLFSEGFDAVGPKREQVSDAYDGHPIEMVLFQEFDPTLALINGGSTSNNLDSRAMMMAAMIDEYYWIELHMLRLQAEAHNQARIKDGKDFIYKQHADEAEAQQKAEDNHFYENIGKYGEKAQEYLAKYYKDYRIEDWQAHLEWMEVYNEKLAKKKEIMYPVWKQRVDMFENWYHSSYSFAQEMIDAYAEYYEGFIVDTVNAYASDMLYVCNAMIDPYTAESFMLHCQLCVCEIECSVYYNGGEPAAQWVDYWRRSYESEKAWLEGIEAEIIEEACSEQTFTYPEETFEGDVAKQQSQWNMEIGLSVSAFGFSGSLSMDAEGNITAGFDSPVVKWTGSVNPIRMKSSITTIHYGTGGTVSNIAQVGIAEGLQRAVSKNIPTLNAKYGTGYQVTTGLFSGTEIAKVGYAEVGVGVGIGVGGGAAVGANYSYDSKTASYVVDSVYMTGSFGVATFTYTE